ncbi:MAG: hypothetical protein M3O28_14955 [Actinomycetota bacterium]|nr:hypothetical protein [Actinomycetota bacterium]
MIRDSIAMQAHGGPVPLLLRDAQTHRRIRPEITASDISLVLWSVSAIVDTVGVAAPNAWRRHLELLVAGLRPAGAHHLAEQLVETPMTASQARRVTAAR